MKLKIVARNRGLEPHRFVCHLFLRVEKGVNPRLGGPVGKDHTLELITTIETQSDVPPGQVVTVESEWPAPDLPPSMLIFKAAPEHSLVWEMLEVRQDDRSLLVAAGMLA